ncbi:70 kD heat shock protein form 1, partial [Aphelenchoides avenae]
MISRIEFNAGDQERSVGISQQRLEALCSDLFDKAKSVLRTAISRSAWRTPTGIAADFVLLVGGSSRLPRFQRLVADVFTGIYVRKSNYAEEAVVRGAAIAAAMLSGNTYATLKGLRINDVLNTPIVSKLPVEALSGVVRRPPFAFVFERNTRLPTTKTIEFRKDFTAQQDLFSEIRHGDTEIGKNNNLCTIVFHCRQRARAEVRVNLVVDEDGILRMSLHSANIHSVRGILASELDTVEQMLRPKAARDRRTRKISQCDKRNKLGALSITVDKAALTHDEIDALRNDLADYYENEVRRHDVDDARNELEAECRAIKRRLQNSV